MKSILSNLVLATALFLGATSLSDRSSSAKCGDPGLPLNGHRRQLIASERDGGRVREGVFELGSAVEFWCSPGYRLRGPRVAECTMSSPGGGVAQWSSSPPVCIPQCKSPAILCINA